jgi:hypothetical protein
MQQVTGPHPSTRLGRVDPLDELAATKGGTVLAFADQLALNLPLAGQVSGQRRAGPGGRRAAPASPSQGDVGGDEGNEGVGGEWASNPQWWAEQARAAVR